MRRFLFPLVLIIFLFVSSFIVVPHIFSDELDDVTKQINDLQTQMNNSVKATKPLESQVTAMQQQITSIKSRVAAITQDVATKKIQIASSYTDLAQKEKLFDAAVVEYYIESMNNTPLFSILSANSAGEATRNLAYQNAVQDQNKTIITNIALSISDLEQKKISLESEQSRLVTVKASLDAQSEKLDKIITDAKAYQSKLSNQIAALSAKQQSLIAAKQASLGLPTQAYTTSGGCSSDLTNGKDPGFSPKFGLFTYGVPHRVGLNQYGAKGRAEAGQSAEDILKTYFNADLSKSYDTGITIHVTGSNEYGQSFDTNWNIEEYVKHIYEIPATWNAAALRAQAVAARSYALASTNNGSKSICPSQSCQVVKQELNSSAWQQAVDDTKGWVLTSGGNPIAAYFSSTAGGYFHSSSDVGWSATSYTKTGLDANGSVNSFSDLNSKAYDKDSPWFYCDWGSRSQYSGTAWLKSNELADIVNVILLAKADSSTQNHLAQLDKPNPDGTDTWDASRVQQELKNRNIVPFTSISGANASGDFGSGNTTTITFSGDAGNQSFSGNDFKNYFNLRAPANINIVGSLYNIEVK